MPHVTTVTDQTIEREIAQHGGLAIVDWSSTWAPDRRPLPVRSSGRRGLDRNRRRHRLASLAA